MIGVRLERVLYRYDEMRMAFDVAFGAGRLSAVTGPSGAGKTTLLNLVAGFEAPAEGRILIGERDVTTLAPAERPVSTLFQEHNLFPHLTAAQNVGLGIHPGLRLRTEDRTEVSSALATVGLTGLDDRLPAQLSGGERQRVAIARALVRRRPVLLLDEPFAALGPAQRRAMVLMIDALRRERGLTVVMVTHQLDELAGIDADAFFVDDGRVVAKQPADEMLTCPASIEIEQYLGVAPSPRRLPDGTRDD